MPSSAARNDPRRGFRQPRDPGRDGPGGEGGQRGAAIVKGQAPCHARIEVIAIQRFRRGRAEKGMFEELRQQPLMDQAPRRKPSILITRAAVMSGDPLINGAIGRSRIKSDDLAVTEARRDIGDASQIENHGGTGTECPEQGRMIGRGQRRALSASRHIGGPEIMHHGALQPLSERNWVKQLQRGTGALIAGRAVKHSLAVHTDQLRRDPACHAAAGLRPL